MEKNIDFWNQNEGSNPFLFLTVRKFMTFLYITLYLLTIFIFFIKLFYIYVFNNFLFKCIDLLSFYKLLDLNNEFVQYCMGFFNMFLHIYSYYYFLIILPTAQMLLLHFLFQIIFLSITLVLVSDFKGAKYNNICRRLDILLYLSIFLLLILYKCYLILIPDYSRPPIQYVWVLIHFILFSFLLFLNIFLSYKKFKNFW